MTDLPRLMRSIRAGPARAWQDATRTAIHEAGHGVVQILEGGDISAISLELGGEWLSASNPLRVMAGKCCGPPSTPATFMAGRVAEGLAFPPRDRSDPAFDGDERQLRDFYPATDRLSAQDDARRLLQAHWPAVCALAELLLEHGELDGREAMFAIRHHLPDEHRDRLHLWGDEPPAPPRRWYDDAADARREHYWQHGHTDISDDRDVEEREAVWLAMQAADPRYRPGTVAHAAMLEGAAAVEEEMLDQIENTFPADRSDAAQELLDLARPSARPSLTSETVGPSL
jgi:hypothetical protein